MEFLYLVTILIGMVVSSGIERCRGVLDQSIVLANEMVKPPAKLRIPQENGSLLVYPELSQWPKLIAANIDNTKELPGKIEAGRELLGLAHDYTNNVCKLDYDSKACNFVIATGHQPTWHHGGIWAKDAAAGQVPRDINGCGLHLVLDHDISDTSLVIPGRDNNGYGFFDAVKFESGGENIPLELIPAPSKERQRNCLDKIIQFGPDASEIPEGTRVAQRMLKRSLIFNNIADFITYVQSNISAQLGVKLLYLPVSKLSQSDAFTEFAGSIIFQAAGFADIYNDGVTTSVNSKNRRKKKIRRLSISTPGEHIELPFWMVSSGGERSSLHVKDAGNHAVCLYSDQNELGPMQRGKKQDRAVQLRNILQKSGFFLRPKAVSLTLFVRLFLADWFIHGLGGALYDDVTDNIINNYYKLKPLTFGVVTATVRLPLTKPKNHNDDIAALKQKLHNIRHHPEKYIHDATGPGDSVQTLISTKKTLLDQISRPDLTKENKRLKWARLQQTNVLLREHARPAVEYIEKRIERAHKYNMSIKVCNYREYFFGLFKPKTLQAITESLRKEQGRDVK